MYYVETCWHNYQTRLLFKQSFQEPNQLEGKRGFEGGGGKVKVRNEHEQTIAMTSNSTHDLPT
jgi:hypothetical protein